MANYDEDMDEQERLLVGMIRDIQEQYHRAAKPYVDRLMYLRSLRPMPPMIITIQQAKDLGLKVDD